MKTGSIGFIGGGRITRIFLQAFRDSGREFGKIAVYDPDPDQLGKLETSIITLKPTAPAWRARQDAISFFWRCIPR
jgi:pyrroline-5-carboxylate reductase